MNWVNLVIAVGFGIFGFYITMLLRRIDRIEKRLDEFDDLTGGTYVDPRPRSSRFPPFRPGRKL